MKSWSHEKVTNRMLVLIFAELAWKVSRKKEKRKIEIKISIKLKLPII